MSVISEQTDKQDVAALLNTLLDQACRDAGMSDVEMEQSRRVAAIEERLVESGRSIKDVYREWETRTPEQILDEYGNGLPAPPPRPQPIETDWISVTFRALLEKQRTVALFDAQTTLTGESLWRGTIEAVIEDSRLATFLLSLASGNQVQARFAGCRNEAGFVPMLIDVKAD